MAKLKKPLFYALHTRWREYRVVAVTTYKPSGRWHGRYVHDNEGTHGTGDLHGRFDTVEAAQAKVAGLEAILAKHKPLIDEAHRALSRIQYAERHDLDVYLKGR